jgi:D-lactate dehydrogenase
MNPSQPLSDLLKKTAVFSSLSEDNLRLLQERLQRRVFAAGELLCREGETGDLLFLIESGEVSVLKGGQDGQTVEVTVLRAGDIAGELSLFGPTTRSATLSARAETIVWMLDHAAFAELLEQHGTVARAMLATLSRHLRRETSTVAKLLSPETGSRFRIAFFDSKPYMKKVFRERNRYDYALEFFAPRLSSQTVAMAAGFQVVCVFVNDQLDAAVIGGLRDLGVGLIALRCAGFNNVDLAACQRHGLSVTRVPAYSPYAVAEHAVALMLALNRRVHRASNRVREGNFSLAGLVGFDMHGKTAGVVGTGKIGRCLLSILAGFGCRLLAYDTYPDAKLTQQLGVAYVPLEELFAAADIISLHAPLTAATRHLVNAEVIARMKRGVMLINTSRGALIDTRALLEGLKTGQIGYAGLDVYEEEGDYFFEDLSDQVIADDVLARLLTFNNVIVTSHQAFLTQEALENIADVTLESIREFELGKRGRELACAVASTA